VSIRHRRWFSITHADWVCHRWQEIAREAVCGGNLGQASWPAGWARLIGRGINLRCFVARPKPNMMPCGRRRPPWFERPTRGVIRSASSTPWAMSGDCYRVPHQHGAAVGHRTHRLWSAIAGSSRSSPARQVVKSTGVAVSLSPVRQQRACCWPQPFSQGHRLSGSGYC